MAGDMFRGVIDPRGLGPAMHNAIWAPARGLSMSDVWATDGVVGRWKLFGLRIAEFITDV